MAKVRNIGAALDVAQEDSATIGGTWAGGDTLTSTINNKGLVLTCGTTLTTPAKVAAALNEALTVGHHEPTLLTSDCTINFGGQECPEFGDLKVTVAGAVVTLVHKTPGWDFTIVFTKTSSSGTVTHGAEDVTPTGKQWFNNADNWEGGSVPSAGDNIILDGASASITHALGNSIKDYDLTILPDYTGDIGLPKINFGGYPEYRTRFFNMPLTVTSGNPTFDIDRTKGGILRIDLDTIGDASNQVDIKLRNTPKEAADGKAVQIVGGKRIKLITWGGNASFSDQPAENICDFLSVLNLGEAHILISSTATFVNAASSIKHLNGILDIAATWDGALNEMIVNGGLVIAREDTDGRLLYQYGGKIDWRGATLVTPTIYGGEFDARNCPVASIGNPVSLFKGAIYRDPHNVMGTPIALVGCNPIDVTMELKDNLKLTPALATAPVIL